MFSFFVFIFGLVIGSFLNAVIYRLEKGGSVIHGRSKCPFCRKILNWYELAPVLSFVFLRGRCRSCRQKISLQYPLVELATGISFLLIFLRLTTYDLRLTTFFITIYLFYIISVLIIIFVYDLKHYIIPDKIIYPAIVITFIYRLFEMLEFRIWDLFGIWDLGFGIFKSLASPLFSALLAGGFFLLLVLVSRGRWMGMGDVKLAFLMGLILGWPNILWTLFLAFMSGAIVGLVLIAFKKKTMKSQIPFGPFLAGSTMILFVFSPIVDNLLAKIFNFW